MNSFNIFRSKKGLTLVEVLIAIVIFIFPIFATLSTVAFLYKQTNSRHLELLAENLSNYILEDLRGRRFYYYYRDENGQIIFVIPQEEVNPKNNLQALYDFLPKTSYVPNPFFNGSNLIMRYDENILISSNNPYIDFNFLKSDNTPVNIENFYNAFKFDLFITRYPQDINNFDNIFETIYKIDLIIKWKEGTRERLLKNSTEVSYHVP